MQSSFSELKYAAGHFFGEINAVTQCSASVAELQPL